MAEEEGFAVGVDLGGTHFHGEVRVLFQDAAVAGGGLEIGEDEAEGLDAVP